MGKFKRSPKQPREARREQAGQNRQFWQHGQLQSLAGKRSLG